MKRIITIMLTLTLVFSSCAFSCFASSSSTGYIKVKKATYLKYKKAYNESKKLKTQIKQLKNTIETMQKEADNKDSMNSWVWMNIKSIGLTYKDKTWTIPADIPEKFMINGTTYYVVKENKNGNS